jgi:hypothetical protein
MPVDDRVREAVLEAFATATGESIAVTVTDRTLMRSTDGHLLVLTTGDLPLRPDLDTDDIMALVGTCDAVLEATTPASEAKHRSAFAAIRHAREKLRACL